MYLPNRRYAVKYSAQFPANHTHLMCTLHQEDDLQVNSALMHSDGADVETETAILLQLLRV